MNLLNLKAKTQQPHATPSRHAARSRSISWPLTSVFQHQLIPTLLRGNAGGTNGWWQPQALGSHAEHGNQGGHNALVPTLLRGNAGGVV